MRRYTTLQQTLRIWKLLDLETDGLDFDEIDDEIDRIW